jgi:hypothetical protein
MGIVFALQNSWLSLRWSVACDRSDPHLSGEALTIRRQKRSCSWTTNSSRIRTQTQASRRQPQKDVLLRGGSLLVWLLKRGRRVPLLVAGQGTTASNISPAWERGWGFGSRTLTSHPVRVFGCPVLSGRAEHSSPLPIPKTVDKGAPRVAYTIARPCYLLARRAVRLDPLTALRCQ